MIHDEWIRNVLAKRPDLTKVQLERTRELMNKHVRDCLVRGFEHLIPTLKLPDPNDLHVLAAAIYSSSSTIITYNIRDFPQRYLGQFGIIAKHPDDFLLHLCELSFKKVCAAVKQTRLSLKRPTLDIESYFNVLSKQAIPKTIKLLKKHSHNL